MSDRAMERLQEQTPNQETSFSLSLKRWSTVMDAYVKKGTFAYHTTMPTDALRDFHQVTVELLSIGTDRLKEYQIQLGQKVRDLFRTKYELRSVAASGFDAPGVLVYYSPGINVIENPKMMQLFQTTTTTTSRPLQIAMGVPWKLLSYEPQGLKTFRMGLFGLDKLMNMDATIHTIDTKMGQVYEQIHQGI
jgi:aspartate aminotransferase-like enzyme